LTASITIILAEEEDHPSDPAISSSSQTQEDSTHQGGMEGAMFTADNMQEDSLVLEASMQQKDSNQLDVLECEPVHQDYDVLHLVTPTEGGTDGIENDGLVTWIASSSRPAKNDTDSPT